MNKIEFAETISMIANAYYRNSLLEEATLTTWYKFFGDFDGAVFREVAENYIQKNEKCPAISNLHGECRRLQNRVDGEEARKNEISQELAGDDWMDFGN